MIEFDENWKKIGHNLYLSKSGIMVMQTSSGGNISGSIKKPEQIEKTFFYRFRPEKNGKTKRHKVERIMKEYWGINNFTADETWHDNITRIHQMAMQAKKDNDVNFNDMATIALALEKYPHPEDRDVDFWIGF